MLIGLLGQHLFTQSLGNDLQPLNSSYVIGLQIRTGTRDVALVTLTVLALLHCFVITYGCHAHVLVTLAIQFVRA